MATWYSNYLPTWVNRWWMPPPRVNPFRTIRPALESKKYFVEILLLN